jgi:hypothetical protein
MRTIAAPLSAVSLAALWRRRLEEGVGCAAPPEVKVRACRRRLAPFAKEISQ